jgi:hypothetical protein
VDLDLDGDRLLVGAPGGWGGLGVLSSAAEVFDFGAGGWSHTIKLFAAAATSSMAVAVDGAHVFTSSPLDDTFGADAGIVYHWREEDSSWFGIDVIVSASPSAGDYFGQSLSADDGWLAVGAYGDDALGGNAGAVWIFADQGGPDYVEIGALHACGGDAADNFGRSVAMRGKRLAVGAPNQETALDPGGKVHVFELVQHLFGETWMHADVVTPADGVLDDDFGWDVALDGELVLAGARGVDQAGPAAGAAYLTSLAAKLPGGQCPTEALAHSVAFGAGKPGTFGVPTLALDAPPVMKTLVHVELGSALVGAPAIAVWGTATAAIPFDGGALYVADPHPIPLGPVQPGGGISVGWTLPADPVLSGVDVVLQGFVLDLGAAGTYHTAQTKGLVVTPGY